MSYSFNIQNNIHVAVALSETEMLMVMRKKIVNKDSPIVHERNTTRSGLDPGSFDRIVLMDCAQQTTLPLNAGTPILGSFISSLFLLALHT